MSPLGQITWEELDRLPRHRLGKSSSFKPSVWRVETPSGPVVVKDARYNAAGTRWLARWLLARERRVLRRLTVLDRVPHLVATIQRDAIVVTWVPGRALDAGRFRQHPRALFEQILEFTERMHALGVFHLDLHARNNILLDDEGRLHMVDFGAAVALGPLGRALFGRTLRHVDRQAAYKFLARFAPESLTDDEAREVLRQRRMRSLWFFTRHGQREGRAARSRLAASREGRAN